MRKLLYLSVALNVGIIIYLVSKRIYYSKRPPIEQAPTKFNISPAYRELRNNYDKDTAHCGLTLIGDSHIQFGPWGELLKRPYCNRGILGDATEGLIKRLYQVNADTCFILIGINDIINHQPLINTTSNYAIILATLQAKGIHTRTIQVPKVARKFPDASRINRRVDELNAWLKQNSNFNPCEVPETDLQPDGVHLEKEGYARIATAISN